MAKPFSPISLFSLASCLPPFLRSSCSIRLRSPRDGRKVSTSDDEEPAMISIPTLVTQLQATGAPESDPAEKPRAQAVKDRHYLLTSCNARGQPCAGEVLFLSIIRSP